MNNTQHNLITVTGLSGSGTSTTCRLLSQETHLEYIYAGALFREMAAENNMDVETFGVHAETHPEIDRELDNKMIERAQQGNVIIEGRMISCLVREHKIAALTVLINADTTIRAERVAGRENLDRESALKKIADRDKRDRKRYYDLYGLDPLEDKWYNIIIDNSDISPEKTCRKILDLYERLANGE